jgi:hypothetical protein
MYIFFYSFRVYMFVAFFMFKIKNILCTRVALQTGGL